MTSQQALNKAKADDPTATKFVVRLYDGFDNEWYDVTGEVTADYAKRVWSKRTDKGTKKTRFADIDYYAIFPAKTTMQNSEGRGERDPIIGRLG